MTALALTLTDGFAQKFNLLIGTYTTGKSEGIYVYEFDAASGTFRYLNKATGVENPSFVTVSSDKKNVYAVNETGQGTGGVSAFAYESKTGALQFLNRVNSGGDHPCYIAVDRNKKHVFAGNYSGGNLSVLPVSNDGSVGNAIQTIQHSGSGPNSTRQEKAHVHMTILSPDEKFLLTTDLGTDNITIYGYDPNAAQPLSEYASTTVNAGAGPRHLTFHPNKKYVYLLQELTGDITLFNYASGKLTAAQTISHISGFKGKSDAADIHISPDGQFLYASYRGDLNEIVIYTIDAATGKLTFAGKQSSLGIGPRNFVIDPTGKYLLVANQKSDSVILFTRNPDTGLLKVADEQLNVGNPVCLVFAMPD